MYRTCALVFALSITTGCFSIGGTDDGGGGGNGPSATSVSTIIGTAAPLAFASSVAMAVVAGETVSCVDVITACAAPPCAAEFTINVGSGCPLPVGDVGSGTIEVSGDWGSVDDAEITTTFQNVSVGNDDVHVQQGITSVSRSSDSITISYVDQDVVVNGGATVEQSSWDITVALNGTPNDPSDDTITIDGTRQEVDGADVLQLSIRDAVMSPDCRLNPISGEASVSAVGGMNVEVTQMEFHSTCDGQADLETSISLTNFGSSGDTIDLTLTASAN